MTKANVDSLNQNYHYTVNLTSITKSLKILLWIYMILGILNTVSNISFLWIDKIPLIDGINIKRINAITTSVISLSYATIVIITAIVFLKWIYRANKNCHGFGAKGMQFTPGWAVGYYFIPLLHIYKPYYAMKEIWKVSTNPANWQNEKGSTLIGWWWALWLVNNFLNHILFSIYRGHKLNSYPLAIGNILSELTEILLCIVAISLISKIHDKQEKLVKKTEYNTSSDTAADSI